ncbi:hypothetical protein H0H92_007059 [Tricholoma furcatifolium]|nr:hypothetical protein H0H92_007059 [Tricholoma furcatifolium]
MAPETSEGPDAIDPSAGTTTFATRASTERHGYLSLDTDDVLATTALAGAYSEGDDLLAVAGWLALTPRMMILLRLTLRLIEPFPHPPLLQLLQAGILAIAHLLSQTFAPNALGRGCSSHLVMREKLPHPSWHPLFPLNLDQLAAERADLAGNVSPTVPSTHEAANARAHNAPLRAVHDRHIALSSARPSHRPLHGI